MVIVYNGFFCMLVSRMPLLGLFRFPSPINFSSALQVSLCVAERFRVPERGTWEPPVTPSSPILLVLILSESPIQLCAVLCWVYGFPSYVIVDLSDRRVSLE